MSLNLNSSDLFSGSINNMNNSQQGYMISSSRLTSGLRINSAKDDPSGLAVRELLRADIATTRQGSRNLSDGISMLQTADKTAGAVSDILIRMKELSVQAQNTTYSPQQRNIMQQEFSDLSDQVAQIAASSDFNGITLHQDGQTIQIAIGDGETIQIDTQSVSVASGDLTTDPAAASAAVDTAITQLSQYRGSLGATTNRMETASDVLAIKQESIMAAESRISDADFAKEVTEKTANQLLIQAAAAMQAQAQTTAQIVTMLIG